MSLVQCSSGGAIADVIAGELHIPKRGAWWANLRLDTTVVPALKAPTTIAAAGGLTLVGSIAKAGVFNDVTYVHVVGGAGGIGLVVGPFSYQSCVLGDPLAAIAGAARETLSLAIAQTLTRLPLSTWTVMQKHAARLLDELAYVAAAQLGAEVNWRTLADGTVWIGAETWPSQSLPSGADVLLQHPVNPWFEIGCDTPSLLPGVNLVDIGNLNVAAVDHWIEDARVRTWAWTS